MVWQYATCNKLNDFHMTLLLYTIFNCNFQVPPRIRVPLITPGVAPTVQITVTPVPQGEEEQQSQHTDQYALELLAYQAIKAKNMAGFKEALLGGIDSTHVFSAIPFDDVANETLLQFAVKENFVSAVETLIFHHKRKNLSSAVMTACFYVCYEE